MLQFAARIPEHESRRLRSTKEELDVVLLHEAVAAVVMERRGGDRLRRLPAERERHRRERRRSGLARVDCPCGLAGEQRGSIECGREIRQVVLHGLERTDRYPELLAIPDV